MENHLEKREKIRKEMFLREEEQRERNSSLLYLSEIVKLEKPVFEKNNLIMAPTGSGKSHFIQNVLIPKYVKDGDKIYYLVSNTALKDSVCPKSNKERKRLSEDEKSLGFFTTQNKENFGNVSYKVHVMTYSEFGKIVAFDDVEAEKSPVIFCDEIHSLQAYKEINNDVNLIHAVRYLFNHHENQIIYYFTATGEYLRKLETTSPGQLKKIKTFDYTNHPKIRRYVVGIRIHYNHLEQIRPHLKDRIEGFNYYGFKALAFTKKIEQMGEMERIFIEEGYRPLLLWSVHNKLKMTSHQIEMRDYILKTGVIPSPYNVLIINGSMQEGWDLQDKKIRLAVINSTNETETIQALGRFRGDITTCVQKTNENIYVPQIAIPEKYIDVVLTIEGKEKLCKELDLKDQNGRLRKWPSIKKMIEDSGKIVVNEQKTINKKRQMVSIIKRPII